MAHYFRKKITIQIHDDMACHIAHGISASGQGWQNIACKGGRSTHQNPRKFINTRLQLSDQMIKAIASTGGVAGVRYHSSKTTPYETLVDMISYIADLVGIEHTGFAWLGHDIGHPRKGYVPGVTEGPAPGGEIEKMTKFQQNSRFIDVLYKRKFSDQHIAMVLGGNFLRVMKEVLPA